MNNVQEEKVKEVKKQNKKKSTRVAKNEQEYSDMLIEFLKEDLS